MKDPFDYFWDGDVLQRKPEVGMIVEIPFGKGSAIGLVTKTDVTSELSSAQIKFVKRVAPLQPIDIRVMDLARFASYYYLYGLGETLLPSIPKWWRTPKNWEKFKGELKAKTKSPPSLGNQEKVIGLDELNEEQKNALEVLIDYSPKQFKTFYLNGVTGSGKTAVYLTYIQHILARDPQSQILIMLPEINLTPQLEKRIEDHLPNYEIVILHSGLSEKQRAVSWYRASTSKANIILGTRLSIMTPMPKLSAIIVDEENDSSFKQQEGLGYSARDLAVWRGKNESIPVILVSATPSAQTWSAVQEGRYQEIKLEKRIRGFQMPRLHLLPPEKSKHGLSINPSMLKAIKDNFEEGRQSLIFINRRGLAPVLTCLSCGWLSECNHCSAYMVMHRQIGRHASGALCCHHCGVVKEAPKMCPSCGDLDLQPLGRGTQKIEDQLQALIPNANVLRVDRDSARTSKKSEILLQQIHQGEAQIIVGTQMLAKGHDYQNIGLVCVLDTDARLYSYSYLASEQLFAQLVQVAGRAGRYSGEPANILIETRYPKDPVYQFLQSYDVAGFMTHLMQSRKEADLPPFRYQALIHAEAKEKNSALRWLMNAKAFLQERFKNKKIYIFDPVPKTMARMGGFERAQLLIEANKRMQLQEALDELDLYLRENSVGRVSKLGKVRWSIERDPLLI